MAQGLQIFDASGNIVLDVTDRVFRVLSINAVGATDGSVTVPELTQGTPIVAITGSGGAGRAPQATVTGTTVSWSYGDIPTGQRDAAAQLQILVF